MAKHRNHVIWSSDQAELKRLKEEYEMLGRFCKLGTDNLIVFALDPRAGRKRG